MAGGDVVVTSENDFSSEGGFSWDVDSSVVVEQPFLSGYSLVVSEGSGDSCVP